MPKKNDELTETEKSPFGIGDEVSFELQKETFTGLIEKAYKNAFLVTFETDDADIIDSYHNKTIVNWKDLTMIKAAPHPKQPATDEHDAAE
ncbi:hypothetical protein B808_128 [Fructilactobacillus florum 8D]|uniref:DUF2187 domain-containing protein n=2 Tax=Fructilactobacillus florum TaxID=640331 RepID=W9EFS0_9LACO|nr:hypothetical protein [Fructilactobacillus florum]EKK20763.1 hypothetical protein B807_440 [Fructilactobacillus florum 2F]ETO40973.1 hypothetical protein B808_128 [Fructilactobacillus florum 8D]KRM91198.1 hypothetical protein FC87_GL001127 [Fructilactobacillus florum DSM 22689 = JCM 16035]